MFADRVQIRVKGGYGGKGCASFRRERFIPKGGPSGGDGARGGNVIIRSDLNEQTLVPLKYMNHYDAPKGGAGSGNAKHGRRGENLVISVPVGTVIKDVEKSNIIIADLSADGEEFVAARGGRGGKGNLRFASSTNQRPRTCEPGQPGEEYTLELELKIIADIGLVGFPNAGKSTFLSTVSNANPKTAPYPFTTRTPQLGRVEFDNCFCLTIADIPGLIEGAHRNLGLGHEFLRHIERTKVLAYMLDMGPNDGRDPWDDIASLEGELECYQEGLSKRATIILANKIDEAGADEKLKELRNKTSLRICPISALLNIQVDESLAVLREQFENTN